VVLSGVFKKGFSTDKAYFTLAARYVMLCYVMLCSGTFLCSMFSNDADSRTRFPLKFQCAFCWCSIR